MVLKPYCSKYGPQTTSSINLICQLVENAVSGSIPNLFISVCILATSVSCLYTYGSLRSTGLRECAGQAETCQTSSVGCVQRKEWGWDWVLGPPTCPHSHSRAEGGRDHPRNSCKDGGAIFQESFGKRMDPFRYCPPFRTMLSIMVATSHISLFKFKVIKIK